MALVKQDLLEIKNIIDGAVEKSKKEIFQVVSETKDELIEKIESSKKEILDILGREVSDLANINRAVIEKNDKIDCRLRIIERKFGIKA